MSAEARALAVPTRKRPGAGTARWRGQPPSSLLEEFEQVYRTNVEAP